GGVAESLQVIELLGQTREIADPVVFGIEEGADVQLIDDRIFVPLRVEDLVGRPCAHQCRLAGMRGGKAIGWRQSVYLVRDVQYLSSRTSCAKMSGIGTRRFASRKASDEGWPGTRAATFPDHPAPEDHRP